MNRNYRWVYRRFKIFLMQKRRFDVFMSIIVILFIVLFVWGVSASKGANLFSLFSGGQTQGSTTMVSESCIVFVDPGHGGTDQGASNGDRLESEDNLTLALAVRDELEARGVTVVMSREDDTTLTLAERVAAAEAAGADIFLSLHRNSSDDADACGLEIWTAETCSELSTSLAGAICVALAETGIQDNRGVKTGSQSGTGDYYVLLYTSMPAVLVEMGFISNETDNTLFDKNLNAYAAAIAEAVTETYNSSIGETSQE